MAEKSLCLSRDEVTELCRTPMRAKQQAFLVRNGIRHYLDNYGWPVVVRSAIEGEPKVAKATPGWKSNKAV